MKLPSAALALALTSASLITLNSAASAADIIADDGADRDQYGYSVSLSGNIGLVGSYLDDDNGDNSGSAYLYRGLDTASGTVTQSAKLVASDGMAGDLFGRPVSISGNTGLVGAYLDDDKGDGSGSAYLFRGLDTATGTVTESAKLIGSDVTALDYFGWSLSLSGNTGLVGAPQDDDKGNASGSAYLFRGLDTATGTVPESAKLVASDGAVADFFGWSVSLSGNTGLVGAYLDDDKGSASGSAYLYRGLDTATGMAVTESAKLVASDGAENDWFGFSASLSGNTALVGAYKDDDKGTDSGSAYLYRGLDTATGTVTESAKLVASDGTGYDEFGLSVSISGNVALVGAIRDADKGSVYLYRGLDTATGMAVTESVKLVATDGMRNDEFGFSVAIDGDNFLISARTGNGVVADSGKAYSGSVASLTVMDAGSTSRTISGISFTSREDWVIGKTTDGNSVTLSAEDMATISGSGKGVFIGQYAGSDNNALIIEGILAANSVNIGALTGNSGNFLRLESTASITDVVTFIMGENNVLSIAGDLTGDGELLAYLGDTTLQVWDGSGLTQVDNLNQSDLLSSHFSGGYTNFTTIPEPSALLLCALAALGLLLRKRRRADPGDGIQKGSSP